jgi:hypothetical protein
MTTIEHEKTPDEHSDIVGGSSASRVMNCPASVRVLQRMQAALDDEASKIVQEADALEAAGESDKAEALVARADKVRASLNKSSTYADEGTALHEVMAYIVDNEIDKNDVLNDPKITELWDKYELKDELMWTCVFPALEAFNKKLDELYAEAGDDAELLIRVESRVEVPGIDGAFGTCDVLIRSPKRTVVWDWKFGAGVPVWASYKVESKASKGEQTEEDAIVYGNDQLMFYARGAMNTFPDYFGYTDTDDWEEYKDHVVDLVICQPRTIEDGAISEFTTDVSALEDFRLDLVDAVNEALTADNPTMKRDDKWCRFAACKTICPLHVRSTTGMASLGEKLGKLQLRAAANEVDDSGAKGTAVEVITVPGRPELTRHFTYPEALVAMLDLAEILEPYIKEAQKQAHAFLEAGGKLLREDGSEAYRLVPKKAGHDKWGEDRKKVDAYLAKQGLSLEQRREPWAPISPAQARDKMIALGKDVKKGSTSKDRKLLDKYIAPGVSSGSTLAPADDPRPDFIGTSEKVAALADKIASLGT